MLVTQMQQGNVVCESSLKKGTSQILKVLEERNFSMRRAVFVAPCWLHQLWGPLLVKMSSRHDPIPNPVLSQRVRKTT